MMMAIIVILVIMTRFLVEENKTLYIAKHDDVVIAMVDDDGDVDNDNDDDDDDNNDGDDGDGYFDRDNYNYE